MMQDREAVGEDKKNGKGKEILSRGDKYGLPNTVVVSTLIHHKHRDTDWDSKATTEDALNEVYGCYSVIKI